MDGNSKEMENGEAPTNDPSPYRIRKLIPEQTMGHRSIHDELVRRSTRLKACPLTHKNNRDFPEHPLLMNLGRDSLSDAHLPPEEAVQCGTNEDGHHASGQGTFFP